MSIPARAALLGALLLAACTPDPAPRKLPTFAGALDAAALDTLALSEDRAVWVAVSGYVAAPHDGRRIPLADATGLLLVRLPDTVAVALPVGARLQARGRLRRDADGLIVDAHEWLYDSTAVPVRSP